MKFLPAVFSISCVFAAGHAQAVTLVDALIQIEGNQVTTGSAVVDEGTETALSIDLSERVFSGILQSNFRTSNPGFNSVLSGDPLLPNGVNGLPGQTDIHFDLLPIFEEEFTSTRMYWDGVSPEVDFIDPPSNVTWTLLDDDFEAITADGGDQLVPGGLIARTSSSGFLHKHHLIIVDDGDGTTATTADEGIYVASLQFRIDGLEDSEPVFFVHRTPQASDLALDQAISYLDANYDRLIGLLPGDFNDDGFVNALDYSVWRDDAGATLTTDDYNAWVANYGASGSVVAATAVPEPSSIAGCLVLLGLIGSVRLPIR